LEVIHTILENLKKRPYFGDGRLEIKKEDILQALSFTYKMDTLMVVLSQYTISAFE